MEAVESVQSHLDLDKLWKERAELDEFKLRDQAYRIYENAYLGRSMDKKQQYVSFRPIMVDGGAPTGDSANDKALVNLCRQINNHHQASFARPPRTWAVPYTSESSADAETKTGIIQGVFRRSRIKSQQTLQSFRLSNRGDAVMGLEWGTDNDNPFIVVRTYDPAMCYPNLDTEDIGGMHDLLVTYEVRKKWAEEQFEITIPGQKDQVRCFIYWTPNERHFHVGNQVVEKYTYRHNLGFVPWRWIFNVPNGHMAQSDIAEVPKIQSMISDMVLLMMDATRKRIDKAYWGKGITGNVAPRPGEVLAFPNPNAQISEFPTADPPDAILNIMKTMQGFAQSMGGISPVSMEGAAGGSIVTGAAVRHQVEAIEARVETKRVSIEHAYATIGEYILRVLEKVFRDNELVVQTVKGDVSMSGVDVRQWYTCEASYGGFEGLGPTERGRWALEGLGRIHDDYKAIAIAYPEDDAATSVVELRDFQIRQAMVTAQAQAAAQQAAGGGPAAGGSAPPGSPSGSLPGAQQAPPIQRNTPPEPPGIADAAQAGGRQVTKLGELQSLMNVIRGRMHGSVWAVGEIAVTGMSAAPRIKVQVMADVALVTSALAPKNPLVTQGVPGKDEPKMDLLA